MDKATGGGAGSGQSNGQLKEAAADGKGGSPMATKRILSVAAARRKCCLRGYNVSHNNGSINRTVQWVKKGWLVHVARRGWR